MTFASLMEACEILARYDGKDAFIAGADHDVIWLSVAELDDDAIEAMEEIEDVEEREAAEEALLDTRLTESENARLKKLGLYLDLENECWTGAC